MSHNVEKSFPAKALITGLRSIGYSFPSAVADIIDNSISAGANLIKIFSDPLASNPYFAVLDNGHGMSDYELDNAMLPGSDRSKVVDSDIELGRFGLGLKSASLSQCRVFTVATKQNNHVIAMSFDLDLIESTNKLMLKILNDVEIKDLPKIDELLILESGTLVIWQNFDKISALTKNFENTFRRYVDDAENHVSLVFHRFYNDIAIYFNDRRIEKRDPFLKSAIGRQQTGRELVFDIADSTIRVVPYSLPYANNITKDEMNLLGNPKTIYDDQGFYIYRNRRLITWGSWLRMNVKSEYFKLARVQIDIPSSLDSVWMLDVKKSSARIPDTIKDRIKIALRDSLKRSKRAVRNPGVKEISAEYTVWNRTVQSNGNVFYKINRDLPLIDEFASSLSSEAKAKFKDILDLVEQGIPKYRIQNDISDSITVSNDSYSVQEEFLMGILVRYLAGVPAEQKAMKLNKILHTESFEILLDKKDKVFERLLK